MQPAILVNSKQVQEARTVSCTAPTLPFCLKEKGLAGIM